MTCFLLSKGKPVSALCREQQVTRKKARQEGTLLLSTFGFLNFKMFYNVKQNKLKLFKIFAH